MIKDIRKNYQRFILEEKDLPATPYDLFRTWLEEAIDGKQEEPTAMTLSTCDEGYPDSRVVLLKECTTQGFTFFTNYKSAKGKQMDKNRHVALNFFWPGMERQVRVKGDIEKLDEAASTAYFHSRPRDSQLGAWASEQSNEIGSREVLDNRFSHYQRYFEGKEIERPAHWGGYLVVPTQIEFWQGRSNRLHDRFLYRLKDDHWMISRLAP
jgi:pyridoxamine 5'-phosphate oxidase